MKKIFTLVLVIMVFAMSCIPWVANAQTTITIGTGTSSDYTFPFNNYYRNSWDEMIYPASSITETGNIVSIGFDVAAVPSSDYPFSTLTIYMGTTSDDVHASTTSWLPMYELTEVYSATNVSSPTATGWMTIDLDTPFPYSGNENLVIVVSKTMANYTNALKFYYTAGTSGVSMHRRSDSDVSYADHPESNAGTFSTYLPNLKLTFTAGDVPVCAKPSEINVMDLSTTSASLTWASEGNVFNLQYKLSTADEWTEVNNVSEFEYTLDTLTPGTDYNVRIQQVCEDGTSGWKSINFTTECDIIATYPWVENFDSYSGVTSGTTNNLPNCWNYINTCSYSTYKGYPVIYNGSSYSPHSGNNHLRFYTYYSSTYDPQDQYAILPAMADLNGKQLTLYARGANANSSFKVGLMTNPADASTFQEIATTTPTTSYAEYAYILEGEGEYVAIMVEAAVSDATSRNIYIDDIAITSCPKPTALAATNVTGNSAELSWTANGGESAWTLYYKKGADADYTSVEVTENPYTLEGLDASSIYVFYVIANCSTEELSGASVECIFTTECEAIANLPWNENFDSYNTSATSITAPTGYPNHEMPACWQILNLSDTTNAYPQAFITAYSSYAVSGKCLFFKSSSTTPIYAVLPEFAENISGLQLTFTYRNEGTGASNGTLLVGYMTDPMDANTFTTVQTCTKTTTLTEEDVLFPDAPAGSYIAFKYQGGTSNNYYLSIDNVNVNYALACAKPKNFAVSEVTAHTAKLAWTSEASSWQICLNDNEEDIIEVNENPYILEGLDASTPYTVKVRANCGNNDLSYWTSSKNFTTLEVCPTPTSLTATELTTHAAKLGWTENGQASEWTLRYKTNSVDDTIYTEINVVGTNTYTVVTNLTSSTTYIFQVKAVCGGIDGESQWSTTHTFTTAACLAPTISYPYVTNITTHSATLNWTENGDATQWVVAYKIRTDAEWEFDTVYENPCVLESLVPAKEYIFYVKSLCGNDGDESQWCSVGLTFTTLAACPAPTNVTCFGSSYNQNSWWETYSCLEQPKGSVTLSWTENGDATAWQICLDNDMSNLIDVTTNPCTLTTTGDYTKSVRVRAKCNDDSESYWSDPNYFNNSFSYSFPIPNTGNCGANYTNTPTCFSQGASLSQQIYTVAELHNYNSINGIRFTNYDSDMCSDTIRRMLKIYMVNTNKESFESNTDWIGVTDADLQYSGYVDFSNSTYIPLKGFYYDGQSNIAIIVYDMTPTCNSSYSENRGHYFATFDAPSQALYYSGYGSYSLDVAAPTYNGTIENFKNCIELYCQACNKPTNVVVNYEGGTEATVSWNSEATSFNIDVNGIVTTNVTPTTTYTYNPYTVTKSYTITGLTPGTAYSVSVQAVCGGTGWTNSFHASDWTSSVSFITDLACPTPENLTVTPYSTSAEVSWTGFSDSYTLEYAPDEDVTWLQQYDLQYDNGCPVTSYGHSTVQECTWGVMYPNTMLIPDAYLTKVAFFENSHYTAGDPIQINIYSGAGWPEMLVGTENVTALGIYGFHEVNLSAPILLNNLQNLWITLTTTTINYPMTVCAVDEANARWVEYGVWNSDLSYMIRGYMMTRNLDDLEWTEVPNVTSPYTIEGLNSETDYMVRVKGDCVEDGESAWVTEVFTTLACEVPANLSVSNVTARSATLNWTENGTSRPCQICLNNDTTNLIDVTTNPYTLTDLTPETAYTVKVRAICGSDDYSSWSSPVTFTTLEACPAPTNVSVSEVESHTATLSWTETGTATAWQICLNDDTTNLIDVTTNSYMLNDLTPETAYTVKVRANCGDTYSEWTNAVSFTTTIACPAPTALAVTPNALTATFTWESSAGEWEVAYATVATADPAENIVGTVNEATYTVNDLEFGDYYFWVRANCGELDGYSQWAGPASVHIGYCVPNPTSHDGGGITGVSFGMGDYVVENGGEGISIPSTSPYYGDYTEMLGAVQAGIESTIAITTATGIYPYTFVIWVDFDNSQSFEDGEIVYIGKASAGNGTHNATITVPADQALGDYRMRIYGAYSYFNSFYNNGNTNWNSAHDPCVSGTYRHANDYTLRVLETPSCLIPTNLAIDYTGGTEATISWTSDAEAWNMRVNGVDVNSVITNPYTLTGLGQATIYSVEVQANCGEGGTSEWSNPVSFTTDLCMPENQCELTFELTDGFGDGWTGCAIQVVDAQMGSIYGSYTIESGSSATHQVPVCDGRDVNFVWVKGSFPEETFWNIYDENGDEIFSGAGNTSMVTGYVLETYNVNCGISSCRMPTNLAASNIGSTSAELSWTENGTATAWQICLNDDTTNLIDVTTNSYTLNNLTFGTLYTVKMRANCGSGGYSTWSNPVTFTTLTPCFPVSTEFADAICEGELPYIWNDVPYNASGDYVQTFTTAANCDSMVTLHLTVLPPPTVEIVRAAGYSATVCEGSSTAIEAVVTGGYGEVTYVWLENGNPLEFNAVLNIGNLTPGADNLYTVEVAQEGSSCYNSASAALNTLVTVYPQFTVNASGPVNMCDNGSFTLTATVDNASNDDVLTYQWYEFSNAVSTEISGANAATYTPDVLQAGTFNYFVEVSGSASGCNAQSDIGQVDVLPTSYTTLYDTICYGADYDFFGQPLAETGSYTHTLQAMNGCDSVITLELTVFPKPVVTISRVDGYLPTVCEGSATAIEAVVTGGYGEITSYQWYKNGSLLPGESNSVLNIENLLADVNDLYTFEVVQTGSGCANTASTALNTLVTVVPIYSVGINASETTVCEGNTLTLNANVEGVIAGDNPAYQWYQNVDGGPVAISGATTTTYSTSDLLPGNTYEYFMTVTSSIPGCSVVSSTLLVSVVVLPTVTIAGATSVDLGHSITLTASGANTYTWSAGSANIGNSASVTVSPEVATTYSVTGTDQYGCTGSASVSVIVKYPPTVTTGPVSDITAFSATCGGNVTANGGANVTGRGVCWSTSHNPTTADAHTTDGTGSGAFTSTLTDLEPNTTYYVRAYATNRVGTAYGQERSFTTSIYCYPISSEFRVSVCASELPYIWNDSAYTESGDYTQTFTNANNCDSIVTLHFTVLPSTVGEFTAMTPINRYISSYPIRFTWAAVENATDYDLYVWPEGESQPQEPTASHLHGTYCVVSELSNHNVYQWFMKAYNTCDTSLSIIHQFTLNVAPSLTVTAGNPVNFGEVPFNSVRSVYFQVNGTALDSSITYQLTGADATSFSLDPTDNWDNLSGGRMQLTFHPTVPQNEYSAQMTFQSDTLVETFTIKGYLSDFYTFTTYVDSNVYAMDSEIPIHGQVRNLLNEPVEGLEVEVYVNVSGYVRTLPAISDANGQFTVTFTPQHSEAGYYTVGSRRAGSNNSEVHDEFNIPGMMLASSDWILWETTIDQADTGTIAVRNRSQIPITNIQVTPLSLPNGCTVQFAPLSLAGLATGDLQYVVSGSEVSTGNNYEEVRLNAVSDEGAAMSFIAWYYCLPQRADLDIIPTSLVTTMTRGKSKVVDFMIYNNGAGSTGNIYVSLPDVPWMSVVGNDTLPSLAAHDSAYISIRLSADSTTDLVRYTGNFAINCERGEGMNIPYDITAISDSTGMLVVDVTDEYTWNTNGGHGPHLAGANVTVIGFYSLETVSTGVTNENGLFVADNLPEGWYKLIVRADRHSEYQTNLYITAGDTNRQDIFIQFQAITWSWEANPTEIEDVNTFVLNVEFETHVPKPVITMDADRALTLLDECETGEFNMIATNHGLVAAMDVSVIVPESDYFVFTPLVSHLDSLPALTSYTIPVVYQRKDCAELGHLTLEFEGHTQDYYDGVTCEKNMLNLVYYYICRGTHWETVISRYLEYNAQQEACQGDPRPYNVGPGPGPGPDIVVNPNWHINYPSINFPSWSGGGSGGVNVHIVGPHTHPIPNEIVICDPNLTPCQNALNGFLGCVPILSVSINSEADGIYEPDFIHVNVGGTIGNITIEGVKAALNYFGFGIISNIIDLGENAGCLSDLKNNIQNIKTCVQSWTNPYTASEIKERDIRTIYSILMFLTCPSYLIDYQANPYLYNVILPKIQSLSSTSDGQRSVAYYEGQITDAGRAEILDACLEIDDSPDVEDFVNAVVDRWNHSIEAWNSGYFTSADVPAGYDTNFIQVDTNVIREFYELNEEAVSQGYANIFERYAESVTALQSAIEDYQNNQTPSSLCATVTVQFTQRMTMTREAFEGTLTINNGHESNPMQDIDVDFVILDENGVDCTHLFQINFLSYNNMTGTNGSASLDAQNTGSIVVHFIPTKQAAPEIAKVYSFGGTLSFIDPFTGESMTYNLYPVDLWVHPSPDLYVNYFMQRDILGDDPLTEDRVEPIVPAELGVIIHNRGAGIANNVILETAEPQIIDNEKGLAVDFAMYGAAFNGNERQLGLMAIPFGNIEPNHTGVGEWWFTSTLLGHFISYEAHVIHNNSFGNPDLSLVSSLAIHPLIHTVYAYGNLDDGINDFLVDDVEDYRNYPDSLYFSNGSRTGVAIADSIGFDHYVTPTDTIVQLTLDPSRIGWNYEQTWDPGRGQYKLISCTRNSDQQIIPLSNVWQTFVTLPVGADPVYENRLHIVDTLSNDQPTTYTLVFSLHDIVLAVDTILDVPDSIITTPLSEVTVKFNKPIVDSTFNYLDMSLKCNNGENLLDENLNVEKMDSVTYKLHLEPYTNQSGYYVLNIQTLDIIDADGFNGNYSKRATWIQNINTCQPDSVSITDTVCDSYTWGGVPYTESGIYTRRLFNMSGCDSVVTLHLTVNHSNVGDTTAVACDRYDWYEHTNLTTSGDYTHTFMNAAGCDSVVTLHLTVNHSNVGDTVAMACDRYDWYEHTNLTASGDYTHTFMNAAGCDSVVTLHLTVNHSNMGDTVVMACDRYDWYEHTNLTTSGDYTHTFMNAAGCDSVVTLHLTINHPNTGDTTAVVCYSYDWYEHVGITESGDYTHTFTNTHGCDSVVTLHLTVNTCDPDAVVVVIVGNNETDVYDGAEHDVSGYDVRTIMIGGVATTLYTEADFSLAAGVTATASRTDAGRTNMGLSETSFVNNNTAFETVIFRVTDGYQTITPRPVTLASVSDSREYNGDSLTNHNVTVGGAGFVAGEGATYEFTGGQLLPGSSSNTFTYTLNSGTLTENYNIAMVFGTLTVENRPVAERYVVEMVSNTIPVSIDEPIVYDGLEHTIEDFVTHTFTVNGHTYTVSGLTASVTQIFAGTYENAIMGDAVVTDEYGNDVTAQFDVHYTPGTLTISKRLITFTIENPEDATKVYDGTPLTITFDKLHVDGLAETDELIDGTLTSSSAEVGEYTIEDGNMLYMMATGTFTKSGFKIKHSLYPSMLAKTLASYSASISLSGSITAIECDGVTYQGHPYEAVQIGTQCWLAENLRNTATAACPISYVAYNEDDANADAFGYLYTWYTAVGVPEGDNTTVPTTATTTSGETYVQGICPDGWAIPSHTDMEILKNFASGEVRRLRDMSTTYWIGGSEGITPNYAFNSRGGGFYNSVSGDFERMLLEAYYWESNSEPGTTEVTTLVDAYYCSDMLFQTSKRTDKRSVRCIRKN